MLFDEIKKANIEAMKKHDSVARAALSVLINDCMLKNISLRAEGKQMSDADVVGLIQKSVKELVDERESYRANDRPEQADEISRQIDIVSGFLPKMMSEDEIRKVIAGLSDRSIKSVMQTFKSEYAGKADMSLVSRIAREQN